MLPFLNPLVQEGSVSQEKTVSVSWGNGRMPDDKKAEMWEIGGCRKVEAYTMIVNADKLPSAQILICHNYYYFSTFVTSNSH